ncbi:MAG: NADH-quinone oxidoreductase subunit N [Anaerolineaceae bacterium]
MTLNDILAFLPMITLLTWAILLLVADLWIPPEHKGLAALLAAIGLAVALGLTLAQLRFTQAGNSLTAFHDMVVTDGFSVFLDIIFLGSGLAAVTLAYDYLKRMGIERGEYYSLLLFTLSGMLLMASAHNLIIVFLALELLSIPLYVLAGFARPRIESEEASLKYFLLGAFATGFVLYGISLIFAATGHTDLAGVLAAAEEGPAFIRPLFLAGAALFLVGLGFKVAAVPFNMWVPDVYQGSPSPVSAFMSVGAKVAGFATLLRVFVMAFPSLGAEMTPLLWGLAALTMLAGNVFALAQNNIKRLLAYSSIANAGYLLMALVPYASGQAAASGMAAMLFFFAAYALTSLGAWAVVVALEQGEGQGLLIDDYAGLGHKFPWLALAMTVFMLSFTGFPLTLGFWGKFFLFRAAVQGGFTGLALIGLLTSLLSAYYYLRVVVVMFMRAGEPQVRTERWLGLTAGVLAVLVVMLSFMPNPLLLLAVGAGIK